MVQPDEPYFTSSSDVFTTIDQAQLVMPLQAVDHSVVKDQHVNINAEYLPNA